MQIDVWSDVVCPWCYIGRRKLELALAKAGDIGEVEIRHRAFQLQPDAPADVIEPTVERLARKYGKTEDEVREMQEYVIDAAATVGLEFDLADSLSGNTVDAHRLLLWAGEFGGQDALLERMFAAYFTEGRGLFDRESLLEIVAESGLDVDAATLVLDSDGFSDEVVADGHLAHELGANGVPFFVFDMKYGIAGAQPLEVFEQTIAQAAAG